MKPFVKETGIAMPLNRINVDTDAIIPKQFLKSISRTGFGVHLFNQWRYVDGDPSHPNPDFVLNKPEYKNATVLVAGHTFGCGSSREHAPWALQDYGFQAVIAPSFGDIFYNNCIKNGLLPAQITQGAQEELIQILEENPGLKLKVDLENQLITSDDRLRIPFTISKDDKATLIGGLDDIERTLVHESAIVAYESKREQTAPWL